MEHMTSLRANPLKTHMLLTILHLLKRLLKTHMLPIIQYRLNLLLYSQLQYNLPHLKPPRYQQLDYLKDGLWNNGNIMALNTCLHKTLLLLQFNQQLQILDLQLQIRI